MEHYRVSFFEIEHRVSIVVVVFSQVLPSPFFYYYLFIYLFLSHLYILVICALVCMIVDVYICRY